MIFYTFISTLGVIIFGLSVQGELTFPFTSCQRNSTNYFTCLKRAIRESWPTLIKGFPEYDFPTLDPFFYDYLHIIHDTNEIIYGEVTMNNLTITGFSEARFFGVRTHFLHNDVFQFKIDVLIPLIFVEAHIDVNGTLLNTINLSGKAHFNATLENAKATCDVTGHVVNDIWSVEHVHLLPVFSKVEVYIRGFFDDDLDFNNLLTNLVNENWPLLYRITLPTLSKEWDVRLANIANIFFSKVPFSKVFP